MDFKNSPKVSVIVPVYNAERFLARCIDSVIAQEFTNWELILVNDGSFDKSLEVLKKCALQDGRIIVINKENGGVSSARNCGLDTARGEWITLLDADDELPPDALSYLLGCVQNAPELTDIVLAGYHRIKDGIMDRYPADKLENVSARRLAMELLCPTDYPYHGYICSKLFKKSIIDDHHLRFDESIFYNEDRLFTFTYLTHCRQGVYSTHPVYFYYQIEGGAMASINGPKFWKFETDLDAFIKMCAIADCFESEDLVKAVYRGSYVSYKINKDLARRFATDKKRLKNGCGRNYLPVCQNRSCYPMNSLILKTFGSIESINF